MPQGGISKAIKRGRGERKERKTHVKRPPPPPQSLQALNKASQRAQITSTVKGRDAFCPALPGAGSADDDNPFSRISL